MSKSITLALAGTFALVAVAPVLAQGRTPAVATVAARAPVVAVPVAPPAVRPGSLRVDPARPEPIRPGGDQDGALQQRLRNACFNSPNPPIVICRRYFGDGGAGR